MWIEQLIDVEALVPAVLDMHQAEWHTHTRQQVEQRILGDRTPSTIPITLVATDGQDLLGFVVLVRHEPSVKLGRPFWIDAVVVAPPHRKRGLATKLIAAAERAAREMGIPDLHALTEIPTLYTKSGWSVAETLEGNEHIMKKTFE